MTRFHVDAVYDYPETTGSRIAKKFFQWDNSPATRVYVAEQLLVLAKLIDSEAECSRGQKLCALVKGSRDVHPGY